MTIPTSPSTAFGCWPSGRSWRAASGAALFLLFFIICGVAAAATHLAFNWGSLEPVIGASGAISGLMAAGMRLLPTERPPWAAEGRARRGAPAADLVAPDPALHAGVGGAELVAGLPDWAWRGEAGLIAWQAHLGGYAAGLLLSGLFDRLSRPDAALEMKKVPGDRRL